MLKQLGSCRSKGAVATADPKSTPQPQPQPQPPDPKPTPPDPEPTPPDPEPAPGDKTSAKQRAGRLNDDAKKLMFEGNIGGAAARFRDAIALDPQPRYYFNLDAAQ